MSDQVLVTRAAQAALFQRQHGDGRPLRALYQSSFSLLRFIHRRWEERRGTGSF
jgi:hypothetical protein